jgi:hypothetical protein
VAACEIRRIGAQRWIKTYDKPNEETYELSPYGVEVQQTLVDQTEAEKQLKHAQQQLDLTNVYPGRKGGHPVK